MSFRFFLNQPNNEDKKLFQKAVSSYKKCIKFEKFENIHTQYITLIYLYYVIYGMSIVNKIKNDLIYIENIHYRH